MSWQLPVPTGMSVFGRDSTMGPFGAVIASSYPCQPAELPVSLLSPFRVFCRNNPSQLRSRRIFPCELHVHVWCFRYAYMECPDKGAMSQGIILRNAGSSQHFGQRESCLFSLLHIGSFPATIHHSSGLGAPFLADDTYTSLVLVPPQR